MPELPPLFVIVGRDWLTPGPEKPLCMCEDMERAALVLARFVAAGYDSPRIVEYVPKKVM